MLGPRKVSLIQRVPGNENSHLRARSKAQINWGKRVGSEVLGSSEDMKAVSGKR